jgi:hypothetical protein
MLFQELLIAVLTGVLLALVFELWARRRWILHRVTRKSVPAGPERGFWGLSLVRSLLRVALLSVVGFFAGSLIASLLGMNPPPPGPPPAVVSIDDAEGGLFSGIELGEQQGRSRVHPYARDAVVQVRGWQAWIREVVRGEEAWEMVHQANIFNQPPPQGYEYLLVRLGMKCLEGGEHGECDVQVGVTGDRGVLRYEWETGVVEPDPGLDPEMEPGESGEGWLSFLVGEDEEELLLHLEDFWEDDVRYVAIDPGASIAVDLSLREVKPQDVGRTREAPVPPGELAVTEDWEFAVREVVWGDEAWEIILERNQFNDPPEEGMAYALVSVYARSIHTLEGPHSISYWDFESVDATGELRDLPSVVIPEPELSAKLYPGGECEGWLVITYPRHQSPLLVFHSSYHLEDYQTRYFALE